MRETIGKIILDDTWYEGEDSIGAEDSAEDELAEIVQNTDESDFNRVIAEKKNWTVIRHLSHLRGNLVSWLPIHKKDQVLEIGSGCGAVTGVLADLAGSVHCIEKSKKRSCVNACRNRRRENVRIDVGRFQDVERDLSGEYDWITLIGVLEHAEAHAGGTNPYADMLRTAARHLAPDGRIVIAIENRLGLKYWAGCREDHVGLAFEGLEGYPNTKGVRTFSKNELTEVIREAGAFSARFYYPYPDYRLPSAIYSDERLPEAGELGQNMRNFDRDRLQVFDETRVFDSLTGSQLFPEFSNSFLVILTPADSVADHEEEERMAYVRFSNERDVRFCIRTDIVDTPAGRSVRKSPCTPESREHIARLLTSSQKLEKQYMGSPIRINRVRDAEDGVILEFLSGVTLEQQMDRLLAAGREEEAHSLILSYLETVRTSCERTGFVMTDAFRKVFGNPTLPEGLVSLPVTDIDMVLSNVLTGDGWNLIDCEWTFPFPVPLSFVLFRIIHYYAGTSDLRKAAERWNLYEAAGIRVAEIPAYLEMEKSFQDYIRGNHVPVRELYEEISPGVLNVYRLAEAERKRIRDERLQVFYAGDGEFVEDSSLYYPMPDGRVTIRLSLPAHVKKLRIDPCSFAGLLTIRHLRFAGVGTTFPEITTGEVITNGFRLDDRRIVFDSVDPQILIMDVPRDADAVELDLMMDGASGKIGHFIEEMRMLPERQAQEIAELKSQLAQREQLIHEMENTKVWKAYQRMKGMAGKGR